MNVMMTDDKRRLTFRQAVAQSIRTEAPYWLFLLLFGAVATAIDSVTFEGFMMLLLAYLGVGAWIVFVLKKHPSAQARDRFDLRGAARNLYVAAWWPWFLLKRKG